MEFWSVAVKAGEPVKCEPGSERYLHLSQASLGEVKDEVKDSIPIFLKINGQELVIGTLSPNNCPQISFDLIFDKEFELYHKWKNAVVYFVGYKTPREFPDEDDFRDLSDTESDSESDEYHSLLAAENVLGMCEVKERKPKPAADKVSPAKAGSAKKKDEDDEDEDEDEDDESYEEESDDDEDMVDAGNDSDEDEDEDDSEESSNEDDATPKKTDAGKKRPLDSTSKTPVLEKKTKLKNISVSPKSGANGKNGANTTTPNLSKQAGKIPTSNGKSKLQPAKSVGQIVCKSCSKTFNSENALQSHTKAKHSAGK